MALNYYAEVGLEILSFKTFTIILDLNVSWCEKDQFIIGPGV